MEGEIQDLESVIPEGLMYNLSYNNNNEVHEKLHSADFISKMHSTEFKSNDYVVEISKEGHNAF